jgi:hypothetical protein
MYRMTMGYCRQQQVLPHPAQAVQPLRFGFAR